MNERYLHPLHNASLSKFTQKTEKKCLKQKRNYCHLHISGMYFPVKVSVFTCVWKIRFEMKRENNQFFMEMQTQGNNEKEREREKRIGQKVRTGLKTGISLSFASCTTFLGYGVCMCVNVSFLSKSSLSFLSQCEIKSMCIVLPMMTRKGNK